LDRLGINYNLPNNIAEDCKDVAEKRTNVKPLNKNIFGVSPKEEYL
jgi:hypothetical protein